MKRRELDLIAPAAVARSVVGHSHFPTDYSAAGMENVSGSGRGVFCGEKSFVARSVHAVSFTFSGVFHVLSVITADECAGRP